MTVGFGTPVVNNMANRATFDLVMTGVTTGQPILVYMYKWATSGITSITDTFTTPYSWIQVDQGINAGVGTTCDLWIGTGGAGTGGTVTVNTVSQQCGGMAVACTGASSGAGLAAIANHANGNGTSATPTSPSVAGAAAGDGAVAAMGTSGVTSSSPTSPWTSTNLTTGGNAVGGLALYPNLPDTTGVTAAWAQPSAGYSTAAATVKAATVASDAQDPMGMSGFFGQ